MLSEITLIFVYCRSATLMSLSKLFMAYQPQKTNSEGHMLLKCEHFLEFIHITLSFDEFILYTECIYLSGKR
jgi:hypothetical protein